MDVFDPYRMDYVQVATPGLIAFAVEHKRVVNCNGKQFVPVAWDHAANNGFVIEDINGLSHRIGEWASFTLA